MVQGPVKALLQRPTHRRTTHDFEACHKVSLFLMYIAQHIMPIVPPTTNQERMLGMKNVVTSPEIALISAHNPMAFALAFIAVDLRANNEV